MGDPQVVIGSANGVVAGNNAFHTFAINNTTGSAQNLTIVWGGSGGGTNARIGGVVIQQVPEPGSGLLLVLGGLSLLATRRRR